MTSEDASRSNLHVVILTRSLGFPNGMAATNRVRLLARGLVEKEVEVTVLCTQVSERPPLIENTEAQGAYKGISFEYTTGQTSRSEFFFVRRYVELKGICKAMYRLIQLKRQRQLDCIYAWITVQNMTISRAVFFTLAKIIKVPVIIELNERPWSLSGTSTVLHRTISPLTGAQGVIAISNFLKGWARNEALDRGQARAVLQVPILVDVTEQQSSPYPRQSPVVLFAGAPHYRQTIRFILDSMAFVWRQYPACRLVITGCHPEDPAGAWLTKELGQPKFAGKVELAGYLSRPELLQRYATARALLVPLFDDVRSQARFPTKIGEYLASGRPIVTNSVGEIPFYLRDGVDAFICRAGKASLFGQKVMEVLADPHRADSVGLAGRTVATRQFHYASHGQSIKTFLESIC